MLHINKVGQNMKKIYIYFFIFIFIFSAAGCKGVKNNQQKIEPNAEEKVMNEKELSLNIVTTDKLLYNMVKDIVQDRHYVDYLFTSRDKIWNYKYSEDSINNISKKDLYFYWGSGMEPWASDFVDKLSKTKIGPINISRGIKTISFDRELKYQDITLKDNPYFWLNIDYFKVAMLNIKNAIQDKDSKDRVYYEDNFSKAIKDVEVYQKKLKEAADKLKEYTFVVDGDNLDYFLKYYGFKTIKIYNYGYQLTQNDIDNNLKLTDKLKDNNNVIFLYDSEQNKKANEEIINKFALKTGHINIYSSDIKYTDILQSNLITLESFINAK